MPASKATFSIAAVCLTAAVSSFSPSPITGARISYAGSRIIRQQPTSRIFNDQTGGEGSSSSSSSEEEEATSQPVSLFADETTTTTAAAKFGDSVPLKARASFGESVPLKRPTSTATATDNKDGLPMMGDNSNFMEAAAATVTESEPELQAMKQRSLVVAVASVAFAIASYLWQFTHPLTPVQLLANMQSTSASLTLIGTNGKPTVVDFWAPWCENCKMAAPTLQKLEEDYKDQVNFVMVNGDRPEAWPLIERFGVDAIPHMAMISAEGDVETALIGPIPKRVLEADLEALLQNAAATNHNMDATTTTATTTTTSKQELPFKMLDAFVNQPELRRIKFQEKTP